MQYHNNQPLTTMFAYVLLDNPKTSKMVTTALQNQQTSTPVMSHIIRQVRASSKKMGCDADALANQCCANCKANAQPPK